MPGRVANVRPGFIVGVNDPTPRFPYWPARIAKGGRTLVPGGPDDPVQIIDVRDLGDWIIRLIESNTVGVFNALGPKGGIKQSEFFNGIKKGVGGDSTFAYADHESLAKAGIGFPICIPSTGESAGFHRRNVDKAIKAGLTFRDVSDTAKTTLEWLKGLPAEKRDKLSGAVTAEQEASFLKDLK